jgi:hypothetical protein
LEARDLVSAEIEARPLDPTSLMMGVIRPVGVATATQMSARLYLRSAKAHRWHRSAATAPSQGVDIGGAARHRGR